MDIISVLIIIFVIFIIYNFNIISKVLSLIKNLTILYKCSKILLIIVPIVIIYFHNDMLDPILQYLNIIDKSGLYNSKDKFLFNLGIINKFSNNNLNLNNKPKKCRTNTDRFNNIKRNLSESKKKYVAASQKWKCNNCNNMLEATYEVDHKLPLYKGGNNEINNLQALCRNCHGNKTLQDKIIN